MKKFKSDIEIARSCKLKPISKILKKINVPDNPKAFSPMGRHIAKINFEFLDKLKKKKRWSSYSCNSKHTYASWRG